MARVSHMHVASAGGLVGVVMSLLCGCAANVARIDGSSDEAFQASHAKLMQTLTPLKQVRLGLAEEFIRAAATPPAKQATSGSSRELVPLADVRSELNGMSFDDIVKLSRSKHVTLKVNFVSEPSNNALERTRGQQLR